MNDKLPFQSSLLLKRAALFLAFVAIGGLSVQAQTPIHLSIDGFHYQQTKEYDGNTDVVIDSLGTLFGVLPGDVVYPAPSAQFASASVGTKTITITFALAGRDAAKYVLDTTIVNNYGVINQRKLQVTTTVQPSYVYSRSTSTINFTWTYDNRIPGEMVTVTGIGTFDNPNVGNRTLTVTYSISGGSSAANYLPPDPSHNPTVIVPKPITVSGTVIENSREYNGDINVNVTTHGTPVGVIPGDTVSPVTAMAYYNDPQPGTAKPVTITYTLNGPHGNNYAVASVSTTADITPRQLTYKNLNLGICKEWDGTDTVYILKPAVPANAIAIDDIAIITTARYDNANVGHNKPIHCVFTLTGNDLSKYIVPAPFDTIGTILDTTSLSPVSGGHYLALTTDGACQGENAYLSYSLATGEPKWYTVDFSAEALAQGFANVGRTLLPTDGSSQIGIAIPVNCAAGTYTATVSFVNEATGSTPVSYPCSFTVNLPKTLLVKLFDDVICVDNRAEQFQTYQWYHNGSPISGATKQYYQQNGGLSGEYYCMVNLGTSSEAHTCAVDFGPATQAAQPTVAITPNPVIATATIDLQGFSNDVHTLRIFNAYGVEVLNAQFSGNSSQLDLAAFPQGVYMVYVDGVATKTVKW